jgi:hypothetical protein
MRISLKLICQFFIVCVLISCTPAHTVDDSVSFARQIGVINQFEISRWHNRQIPRDSRLYVSSADAFTKHSEQLIPVVSHGLSPYFASVLSSDKDQSLIEARKSASLEHSNLIIYIELIDKSDNRSSDNASATMPETDTGQNSYTRIDLLLSLIDVANGQTLDKIKLSSNTSIFNSLGADLSSLLEKPLMSIGRDLTGD